MSFLLLVWTIVGVFSNAALKFSVGGCVLGAVFILVAIVISGFNGHPFRHLKLQNSILYFAFPLALVFAFPSLAVLILAVTYLMLKILVAYFYGLAQFDPNGRQRILREIGLSSVLLPASFSEGKLVLLNFVAVFFLSWRYGVMPGAVWWLWLACGWAAGYSIGRQFTDFGAKYDSQR